MNGRTGNVLIVDDDKDILHAAKLFLKHHVALVHTEANPEHIPTLLQNQSYDVIMLDMNFTRDVTSGQEGFHWLGRILRIDPQAVVILITAYGDVEIAVRAIKEGATDFILKPWHNEKLLATVSAAMNLRRSRTEVSDLRSRQKQLSADLDQRFQNCIGSSPAMEPVFSAIEKVAATDANVLILGENGTGKELAARAIHRQSPRAKEVFISVDMGAITESLFESELFGHVKGAFNDAKEDRAGRFEVASGGTLFLDEIGNLSLPLQSKLLSVIENRTVTRVGSNRMRLIDVRLICATNLPIHDMVSEHRFRQDLRYRSKTVDINLPPLRERSEDVPLLEDQFWTLYSKKYNKSAMSITAPTLNKLKTYHWPGNIRELRHAIERAVIMSDSRILQPSDFFLPGREPCEGGFSFDTLNLDDIEKEAIRTALKKYGGNISHAARDLGLTRTSLYRRMEKYDL